MRKERKHFTPQEKNTIPEGGTLWTKYPSRSCVREFGRGYSIPPLAERRFENEKLLLFSLKSVPLPSGK